MKDVKNSVWDALGLQESSLCNNVFHGRFHEASGIAWKVLSSQFWCVVETVEEMVGENSPTLPVFTNNFFFQDDVMGKKNNNFTSIFLWSSFVPSVFENKHFSPDLKKYLTR